MTSSFQADPQAQKTAGNKFQSEVQPINTLATKTEQLHTNAAQAGTYYADCGTSFHATLTTMIQTLLEPMAAKTMWVSDTLQSTAANYAKQESTNQSGINQAGQGA